MAEVVWDSAEYRIVKVKNEVSGAYLICERLEKDALGNEAWCKISEKDKPRLLEQVLCSLYCTEERKESANDYDPED